jgi:hypothetical protein
VASRLHAIIPRVAIAVGLPGSVLLVLAFLRYTRPYVVPSGSDIFSVVQGRWAWTTADSGCITDWHRITISPDHQVMIITSSKPYKGADGNLDSVAVYDIQAHTQSWVRGAIRGETRLTADGRPVVWDLVLRSPDRYAWHRTDWIGRAYTLEIQRCPGPPSERSAKGRPASKR